MRRCINSGKRGLSEVIVTLLLVMLAIVLVGAVFVVVNNLIKTGSQETTYQAKCVASSVGIVSFSCTQTGSECNVTIKRTLGSDTIGGVRLIFSNSNGDSNSSDSPGNFITPSTKKVTANNLDVANITQISAAVYFTDSSGKIHTCSSSSAGLVGSITSVSGTTAGGGSTGGTTTTPSGTTTTTTACTSDLDCGSGFTCNTATGICQCTPATSSYFSSYCSNNNYQCGTVQVSNGTCGTTSLNCTAIMGGCSGADYCDSNHQCQAPILLSNGTIDSVWPSGAPRFFDSKDLPTNETQASLVASGAYTQTGSPSYVRFPLSNDPNCEEVGYIQYQNLTNMSYVSLTFSSYNGYANITNGDQYRIWDTQAGCMADTGTN